ncbi:MAG: hypothetical protein LBC95_00490 [Candidatus Nomurabacteria bacterium]|jgi:hypothetical protein|nr:hypothetical protein [Candidatus Nomurabacteria bacterium]
MVCIAAFILLAICVLSLPIIRIFSKKTADNIWNLFKKSIYCFTHRVTFRKCDSTFKDDVKNSILRRVVVRRPTWVKPLGVAIEVLSVLIILTTIWSLAVGAKSLVSLAAYGMCDIVTPEACVVGDAEACYAGEAKTAENPVEWLGNWFVEFGEAIVYLPIKFSTRNAAEYIPADYPYRDAQAADKPAALDIFDPGCKFCRESYTNQLASGFFDKYNTALLPFALRDDDDYRFANSDLIVRYIFASRSVPQADATRAVEWRIIDRLFTENSPRKIVWQEDFNNEYSDAEARQTLNSWLADFGYDANAIEQIAAAVDNAETRAAVDAARDLVENQIQIVKIPTMIIDNERHEGLFKK